MTDTSDDIRWPQFCAAARAYDVHSLLCMPLWINERNLGALTLYSSQTEAFSLGDTRLISLFATLARASQATNVKLPEVARHLTETGELLGEQQQHDGNSDD